MPVSGEVTWGVGPTAPEEQLFQGTHFRRGVNIPQSVVAGQEFTISGVQHYDNAIALQIPRQRTRLDVSYRNQPITFEHGQIPHCNTSGFSFTVVAPAAVGTTFSVELRAQQLAAEGWQTRDTLGPIDVQVVSTGQKRQELIEEWGPWLGLGGVGGAVVAPRFDQSHERGLLIGAGVGAGAKLAWDQVSAGAPQIGTVELLAAAAVFGTAAWFLTQVRGITPGL